MRLRDHALLTLGWLVCVSAFPACTRREIREREMRDQVAIVAAHDGDVAEAAMQRVVPFGRAAIPEIEAALPKASFSGQLNLVLLLRRIGDEEAVPLLAHLALRNEFEAVRIESEMTLRFWARGTGPRADRARAALRAVEERTSRRGSG